MVSPEHRRPDVVDAAAVPVPFGRSAAITCTLPTDAIDDRLTDWQTLLDHAVKRVELGDGLRVEFEPTVPGEELMRLVIAEQSCCGFLRFAITADERGIALEIRSEADGVALVRELFGERA